MRGMVFVCVAFAALASAQFIPVLPLMPFNERLGFNPQALMQTGAAAPTTIYQSDISGVPLRFGDFYHKSGEAYDITAREYSSLPAPEKAHFVPISNQADLERIKGDYRPAAVSKAVVPKPVVVAQADRVVANTPVATKPKVVSRSDVSNKELQFGNWYHKVGSAYDLTGEEYLTLSAEDKGAYIKINSQADFDAFMAKENTPIVDSSVKATPTASKPDNKAKTVSTYKSDLSHEPLQFGNHYHKIGFPFDISASEYNALSESAKAEYTPINSQEDMGRVHADYPSAKSEVVRAAYRSDISDTPLEYGNWYHRVGTASDISGEEYARLPESDKSRYAAIDSKSTFDSYKSDYHAKYRSDISDTPLAFGNFYHKVGAAYDINTLEFNALSEAEQRNYVAINNEAQLQNYADDYHKSKSHVVKTYKSNFSGQDLTYGNFYHKTGHAYDVTRSEYEALPSSQKALFVAIGSPLELEKYSKDYNTAGAWVTRWRSDISGNVLEFGKFYHKAGAGFDISETEYLSLPPVERSAYVRIDNAQDLLKYTRDWQQAAQQKKAAAAKATPATVQPAVLKM